MSEVIQRYNEAEKLKDEGKYDEAVEKLNALLADHEDHVLSHLALSAIYSKQGKHAEAVKHGERACELDPNDSFNFTAMSVVYQKAFAGTQNRQYIQAAEDAMARASAMNGR